MGRLCLRVLGVVAASAVAFTLLLGGVSRPPDTDASIICAGHGNVIAPFDGQTGLHKSQILCCTGLFVERAKTDPKYVTPGSYPWFGTADPGPVPEFETKAAQLCARENRGGILLKQSPVRVICQDGTSFHASAKQARGGCENVTGFGLEARVRRVMGWDQLCLGTLQANPDGSWFWQAAKYTAGPCQ